MPSGIGSKPFEQGDLDGLCGVYAVINAVRLAAHPHHRLRVADCRGLFAALLAELADEGRLRGFVAAGLGPRVLVRLLRRAEQSWLRPLLTVADTAELSSR